MMTDDPPARPARKPFWRGPTIGGMMAIVAALSLVFAALNYRNEMGRKALDASRRAQCVNNLKQLGLAIHQYEARYGTFPPGTVDHPDLPTDRRLGWIAAIAPDLDLPGHFQSIDLALSWDDPLLKGHRDDPPWALTCPSSVSRDPTKPRFSNFVGIGGLGVDAPGLPVGDTRSGFFNDHRGVRVAEVTDGLANTMAASESTIPDGPWIAGGRHIVRGLDPARQPYLGVGRQFGSFHRGGVNILMADGSVRTIRPTIDPEVFEAQSTIAGGEAVPNIP